jgi:hypothetical protein
MVARRRGGRDGREPLPAALAESDLLEVGLRPGDRVRWRRREGGAWHEGVVERRERDGSIGVRDEQGAARAIPLERLEVRGAGPRGGTRWEAAAARAARDEQLGIW